MNLQQFEVFQLFRNGKKDPLPWKVYILICPLDRKVKYVGCTNKPKSRLNYHMVLGGVKHIKRENWIRKLLNEGKEAKLEMVAAFKHQCQAKIFERDLIQAYLVTGIELYNIQSRKLQDV